MGITRRTAIRALVAGGATAATAALPTRAWAREGKAAAPGAASILYDSTRCVGCKDCVRACAEANGGDRRWGAGDELTTGSLTAIRRTEYDGVAAPLKLQCMHCVDPACVSACMLGAMHKGPDGARHRGSGYPGPVGRSGRVGPW